MPFNPTRRNRNIGTAKQGHGRNNRLVVPRPTAAERSGTTTINPARWLRREVGTASISIIEERTSGGCHHACTPEDLAFLLSHVPSRDLEGLSTFILKQPTRKERILRPVWGRMSYLTDLRIRGHTELLSGPVVFLEAMEEGTVAKWPAALDPDDAAELERLAQDGHRIEGLGRRYIVSSPSPAIRATQLYRTLLHEIGHWVDWLEKVERPASRGEDPSELSNRYFARPAREREAFAHRYAGKLRQSLQEAGIIPFARMESTTSAVTTADVSAT